MIATMKTLLVTIITVALLHGVASAEDEPAKVKIKAWKADPVELYDGPDGKVVSTKGASAMPMEAERVGGGWLKVSAGGKS